MRIAPGRSSTHSHRLGDDGLLSADEERSLARAIAGGDAGARGRLARSNLRLVVRIARDYAGRGLELDDLVGEGNLGLLRAVEEFDPGFGVRFSTYAAYWIRQAIGDALINRGATIRLPAHMVRLLSLWRRAERELSREQGRAPEFEQVAASLGLSDGQRGLVEDALRSQRVGGGQFDEEGRMPVQGTGREGGPEAEAERSDEARVLRERMELLLGERERLVLSLRFGLDGGEPLTLKEVGRRLGVTREWARKIEMWAVARLREGVSEVG